MVQASSILTTPFFFTAELFPGRADGSRSASEQGWFQIAALVTTLTIAIISGLIVGWIAKLPIFYPPKDLFQDNEYWFVEGESESEEGEDDAHGTENGSKGRAIALTNVDNRPRVDTV